MQGLLRHGHRTGLQAADLFRVNGLLPRQFQGEAACLGAQGPSGGGHADPLQAHTQALLQPFRHASCQGTHLPDIVDLAVHHGPFAMLCHLHVQDFQAVPHGLAHHANHTARADIQGKDQVLFLHLQICHRFAPLLQRVKIFVKKVPGGGNVCRLLAAFLLLVLLSTC